MRDEAAYAVHWADYVDVMYTEVLIRRIKRIPVDGPPLILARETETIDFVYTAAQASVLALDSDVWDEVWSVSPGTETSLDELPAAVPQVADSPLSPKYWPRRNLNPATRCLADAPKAEQLLHFKALVKFDDGLRRVVECWRANRPEVALS